ncbi:MAG TPA: homoprotocatechuate degradation operon regulator HpaR [Alphaproteobacteria bacterium]|nr:homoprotocatechuate degradation operon regulator HpaR [Alphaproteobacteria bacterium]
MSAPRKSATAALRPAAAQDAPMRPFSRSLPMQLMRAREAVMQRFRPHLQAHGLSDQQWRILRALAEAGALEVHELAARCAIHPPSLSRILPRMEAAGLVERRPNAADQRRVIVSLAAEGRALFDAMALESEQIYAALARDIGAAELSQVYNALDHLIGALAASAGKHEPD